MNARIVGLAGPLKGANLPLEDQEISVGREPSNKLWTADSAMSRRHCTIVKQDGRFILSDLGGRNGTRVNGERIEKQELCHQDQISVGNSRLVFLLGDGEAIADRNPLELDDTTVEEDVVAALRPEDSTYFHPERASAQPSWSACGYRPEYGSENRHENPRYSRRGRPAVAVARHVVRYRSGAAGGDPFLR